jgi:chitinase
MLKCALLHFYFREELRGISRANNAKDVDWSKVANSISIEVTTKPSPVKISVSEVLKRVRPQKQNTDSTALLNVVDPHGKQD